MAVRDHFDIVGIVYGLAVQRAMSRGTASFTQQVLEIAASACSTSQTGPFQEVVTAFHDNVASATRSRGIEVALRALSGFVPDNFFALAPEAKDAERSR